jgi:putative transposase
MIFPLVRELAADGFPVEVTCRVLGVSRSGFYDWATRLPSARAVVDAALSTVIAEIHLGSPRSYGAPRVHSELRMARDIRCGRKRVGRLMRAAGIAGICHHRKRVVAGAPPRLK